MNPLRHSIVTGRTAVKRFSIAEAHPHLIACNVKRRERRLRFCVLFKHRCYWKYQCVDSCASWLQTRHNGHISKITNILAMWTLEEYCEHETLNSSTLATKTCGMTVRLGHWRQCINISGGCFSRKTISVFVRKSHKAWEHTYSCFNEARAELRLVGSVFKSFQAIKFWNSLRSGADWSKVKTFQERKNCLQM